jgi:hypothetical protein
MLMKEANMKAAGLIVVAAMGIASTGALAETGVRIGDVGYVANVFGRGVTADVGIAGPLTTRPGEVTEAGREQVQGPVAQTVMAKGADVNEVFGRT